MPKKKKKMEPHEGRFVLHGMLKTVDRVAKECNTAIEVQVQANRVKREIETLISLLGG